MSKEVTKTLFARRQIIAGAAIVVAAPFVLQREMMAQQRTIQVGIWAGAQGEFIKKSIVPAFEKDFGCRVLLEEGNTLAQLARMRAERENPRYTVMFIDDFAVSIARAENLLDPLPEDKMPNLSRVFKRYRIEGGYGVAIAMSVCGMFYNTKTAKKPESYADLWDKNLKSRLTLSSIRGTEGIYMVAAAAAIATGKPLQEAQYDGDAGFRHLADLKQNVLNIFSTPSQGASLVIEGEAALGSLAYSKWVYPYKQRNAPIDMAFAREGSFPGVNCQVLVKKSPNQDIGAAFMNRMLDPKVQLPLSEFSVAAPTISDLTLSPGLASMMAYPEIELDRLALAQPDWAYLNKVRGDWTDKWNRLFAS